MPTKIPSTPNKTPSAQFQSKEYAKKKILIYAVLSRFNFLSRIYALFWLIIYRPEKYGGVPKMTNMRCAGFSVALIPSWTPSACLAFQLLLQPTVRGGSTSATLQATPRIALPHAFGKEQRKSFEDSKVYWNHSLLAFFAIIRLVVKKQARKSSEDTQVAGYARFEKVLGQQNLGPKYFYQFSY